MNSTALMWLLLNIFTIICLGFYSMLEMACVSLNKVRLDYYVSKKNRQALWLKYLLQHPFRLFGTTLIGVNIAMVVGSECSREFHQAIGINPDLAPLTQVIIVVIFGELAPMFAARHYAEHVAMLGSGLLYASAKIMTPLLWIVGYIIRFSNWIVGSEVSEDHMFLTQEELQKILEEHGDEVSSEDKGQELNLISANIFTLRTMDARQIMTPLEDLAKLPSNATIAQMRNLLKKNDQEFVPIYHRDPTNIISIAFPRDLIRIPDTRRVRDHGRQPWFITQQTKITQILHQFRRNNLTVAVILDRAGKGIGLLNLGDVLDEIFGEVKKRQPVKPTEGFILERTFPGDMKISEFQEQFEIELDPDQNLTFHELMEKHLGHNPEEGDSVYIAPFEITASEVSLLEVKSVTVKTKS